METAQEVPYKKYTLRPFRAGDEPGIRKLWEIAFNARMPLERFAWKYLDNPYDQAMMLCVDDNGEVVTFYGGIPYRFQYRDKVVHGVQLMDIMSHPDHRHNKVFARTADQFISHFCTPDQISFMYGFPGAHHFAIGERILQYRKTACSAYFEAKIPEMVSDLDTKVSNSGVIMEETAEQDLDSPAWQKLWPRLCQTFPCSLVRDAGFLQWRFFNHPEKTYGVYKFTQTHSDGIIGYAVLSFAHQKAVLVDFLAMDSFELFRQMLHCLKDHLLEKQMQTLVTWLPDTHFLADWISRTGWRQCDEPTGIIPTVALFDHSPPLDWITSHIYYTMADADLF